MKERVIPLLLEVSVKDFGPITWIHGLGSSEGVFRREEIDDTRMWSGQQV